ncbi:hypothetical protein [Kluyvera georgiana]|uniref:hypothetical protein n=1 Tax=Kluyvera georgiana TaxID=73098 RepID=UPI002302EF0C|nr:hypothetical protein [Kluyvera georgiana]MDA8493549.1 hypothetical protein [Kluyvera georgiana]
MMKKIIALSAFLAMGLCSTAFAADHQEPPKKPPVEQQHNGQSPQDNKGPHQHDGKGQPPRDNKGPQHDGKGQPPKHDGDNKLPPPNGQHN